MRFLTLLLLCVCASVLSNTNDDSRIQLEAELQNADSARQIAILQQLVKQSRKQDPPYALHKANQLVALLEANALASFDYLDALRELATLQVGQGLLEAASVNAEKLRLGAQGSAEHNLHVQALKIQGVIARIQSNYAAALDYFQQAKQVTLNNEMTDVALQFDYEISIIYYYQGRHDEAIELLKNLQVSAKEMSNQVMLAKVLNILGIVFANQSRFEESLDIMLQALEIQRARGSKGDQQALLNNIGVTYNRIGKKQQALEIYIESLDLAVAINDVHSESLALLNIAAIEQDLGDFEASLANLTRGMAIANQLNDKNLIAQGLNGLADYYLTKDNFTSAIELSLQALELADSSGDKTTAVKPRQNLATAHMKQGDLSTALTFIQQAITLALELENKSHLSQLYQVQADIFEQGGHYSEALQAHRRYAELNNELFNAESDRKLAALRAKNESLQKDRKIESLATEQRLQAIEHEKALALKDQAAEQNRFERNIVAAFATLVILLVFMFYRRRLQTKLNKKLSGLVKDRTRELAAKNIELERAYAVMETQSLTDQLTKLHNRRFLMQKLPPDLAAPTPNTAEQDFVFMLLDLDNFKAVNDTYGHTAGDLILIEISELLKQVFRSSDYMIRWGGEEFLVVMRHINRDNASAYAERLRRTVEQHNFKINPTLSINMTCSIGFASFPLSQGEPSITWNQTIDIADICLYAAKHSQKNAWVGIDHLSEPLVFKDLVAGISNWSSNESVSLVSSLPANAIIWPVNPPQ